MKPARVRLIDLGLDADFDVSMSFSQSMIQSLVARSGERPVAEVEFIRTRDIATVTAAFQHPAHVLHVLGHGETSPDDLGFWSDDEKTNLSLTDLAERFAEQGEGIEASVVFADCCRTAQGRFVRAIRHCIEQPIAYIGARRSVNWHESTTFASAFYATFFRDRGLGVTATERGALAAERAVAGYQAIVGGQRPFELWELEPSRRAKRTLGR